jgi:hypothetical protein
VSWAKRLQLRLAAPQLHVLSTGALVVLLLPVPPDYQPGGAPPVGASAIAVGDEFEVYTPKVC